MGSVIVTAGGVGRVTGGVGTGRVGVGGTGGTGTVTVRGGCGTGTFGGLGFLGGRGSGEGGGLGFGVGGGSGDGSSSKASRKRRRRAQPPIALTAAGVTAGPAGSGTDAGPGDLRRAWLFRAAVPVAVCPELLIEVAATGARKTEPAPRGSMAALPLRCQSGVPAFGVLCTGRSIARTVEYATPPATAPATSRAAALNAIPVPSAATPPPASIPPPLSKNEDSDEGSWIAPRTRSDAVRSRSERRARKRSVSTAGTVTPRVCAISAYERPRARASRARNAG